MLTAGCGPTAPTVHAVIDTLPGGILRVRNPAPSGWSDTNRITFTEIGRIQPGDGEPGELGDIRDMVVGDDGSIYVAVEGPTRIDHFAADGRYLGPVGRQGSGPGEYQATMLIWAAGNLIVHDPQTQRTTVFDPAGTLVRSWPSTCCIWRTLGSDSLGRAYVPVMPDGPMEEKGMGWIRYAVDGTVVDTIWRRPHLFKGRYWEFSPRPGSMNRWYIPYQPSLQDTPWIGGGLLIGDNATYSLTLSPRGTDSTLVFGRAWTPEPVPEAIRKERLASYTERNEALKAVAKLEDIPETAPAFSDMLIDAEHRIWVQLTVPRDTVGTYWDVFTPNGVWLGTVHAPFRQNILAFRPGEVIVATTDDEDLPVIIRYRMVEAGSGDTPATTKLGS